MRLNVYPKNKRKFIGLIRFSKEIINICKTVGVIPIEVWLIFIIVRIKT